MSTATEVHAELQRQVSTAGGVMAWARKAGVSHTVVSLTLSGERSISEGLANAAGFIAETTYRRVGKGVA